MRNCVYFAHVNLNGKPEWIFSRVINASLVRSRSENKNCMTAQISFGESRVCKMCGGVSSPSHACMNVYENAVFPSSLSDSHSAGGVTSLLSARDRRTNQGLEGNNEGLWRKGWRRKNRQRLLQHATYVSTMTLFFLHLGSESETWLRGPGDRPPVG